MPQNLNALIRYKTIDSCLRSKSRTSTINVLIDRCTEALGENRGVYKKVSERTIRDDIRVMKSDILGFNAPILVKDGVYFYTDPDFSIFNVPIKDVNILETVLGMLMENREKIGYVAANNVIIDIMQLVGKDVPDEIYEEIKQNTVRFCYAVDPMEQDYVQHSIDIAAIEEKIRVLDEIRKTIRVNIETLNNAKKQEDIGISYFRETVKPYNIDIEKLGLSWLYHWRMVFELL
jgi:hypothetical protein